MKLNPNGSVNASSVEDVKRINLTGKESETIRNRLAKARNSGKVKLGEIAKLDDKKWLRVSPSKFNGSAWIEVQ